MGSLQIRYGENLRKTIDYKYAFQLVDEVLSWCTDDCEEKMEGSCEKFEPDYPIDTPQKFNYLMDCHFFEETYHIVNIDGERVFADQVFKAVREWEEE